MPFCLIFSTFFATFARCKTQTSKFVYKKIAFLIFIAAALASCGTGRKAVSGKKASSALHDEVIQYGRKYLGKPYRYAAKGPHSFDCSGYTSFVFSKFGYKLSPSSAGQDRQVSTIKRKEELAKGDLVFFEGRARNGRVGHVGIVTDVKRNGEFDFIHASTNNGVIISKSTEPYYASRYLRGGRVIDDRQIGKTVTEKPGKNALAKQRTAHRNAYVPATAQKEPAQPDIPVVAPASMADSTAMMVAVDTTAEEQTPIILVQTDPAKNPKLADNDTPENRQDKANDTLRIIADSLVTVRTDSLDVPEPVSVEVETEQTTLPHTHTVKAGETLYAISRKYNCTVEQLRQWNPQMGEVLKAGTKINIK